MGTLDNLPPDQRAVLQMVLQRGRSYDEIAGVLSIGRAAVRQRALDAIDAIAPATVVPGPERALVTDYLLRQLPDRVAEQVYAYLEASESDREWAQAVRAELQPLSSQALPEIPVGAPLGADDRPDGGLEHGSDPPATDAAVPPESEDQPEAAEDAVLSGAIVGASVSSPEPWSQPATQRSPPRSSRRGGAILLGAVAAVIVIAVIVGVVSSGGSSTPTAHTGTGTAASTTPTRSGTTTTAAPQILAQLNLTSPTGAADTVGVVQVIREDGVVGVVIDAQGVPANTTHNAYAVWLYNSPSSHKFVGFVKNLVGKSGKLAAEGELPAGAAKFHRLLITLETQSAPTSPGEVVLSGPFRERP